MRLTDYEDYRDFVTNPPKVAISTSNGVYKGPVSEKSANLYLKNIFSGLDWLVRTGYLKIPKGMAEPPHRLITLKKIRDTSATIERIYKEEVADTLMASSLQFLEGKGSEVQAALFYFLLWGTSGRSREIQHLKWSDLTDYAQGLVCHFRITKTGRPRLVAVLPECGDLIRRAKTRLAELGFPVSDSDYVLCKRAGGLYDGKTLRRKLDKLKAFAKEDANEQDLDPTIFDLITNHWVRHSSATYQLNVRKIPIPIVSKRLGHLSMSTTSRYTHSDLDDQFKALLTD